MRSLRHRAILGGLIWAGIAIAIGGLALIYFFDGLTQRRFDDTLAERHLQVISALGNSGGDPELVGDFLTDPAYERPYSGRYWQIVAPGGDTYTSRSMFDAVLTAPEQATAEPRYWDGEGPDGPTRGLQSLVTLDDGSAWVVVVAESLQMLLAERALIRDSLLTTFALVGAIGVVGAALLTTVVVRPLDKLGRDVAHRWDKAEALNPADYPQEVAPLANDINALLKRNRDIVERGRRQAADLAHALKTPIAIMRNEVDALAAAGADTTTAQGALERVEAQLHRSLARVRAANSGGSVNMQTDLSKSVERLARLFHALPDSRDTRFTHAVAPDLSVSVDMQDVEEILGNLLENAFKWRRSQVRLKAWADGSEVAIAIEDDGPGIAEEHRREALRSGGRLDSSAPGTGLGLAIVSDLVQA